MSFLKMLKKFFPEKARKQQFLNALEAITDILVYETRQTNNEGVITYLNQLESLTEQFLKLEKDNPELYKELAFDKAYEALATQSDSPQVYYAVYAVTFTKIINNLFRINEAAYEVNNTAATFKTIEIAGKILKSISSSQSENETSKNKILVEIFLDRLAEQQRDFATSNVRGVPTLERIR
jgi:hypothetical protein